MKIVSFFEGITTWSACWDEIRPQTGIPQASLVSVLRDHFQFQQVSVSPTAQQSGLALPLLAHGRFMLDGEDVAVSMLDFQAGGIVVSCPHTHQSEAFTSELMSVLVQDLSFRMPQSDRRKAFRSTIVSEYEPGLKGLLPKWAEALSLYAELCASKATSIEPFSLRIGSFGPEGTNETEILIEKRFSAPESANWLFSQMFLDSASHVAFLERLEQIFAPAH